jgi:tRNA-specific 2-thiouridylase
MPFFVIDARAVFRDTVVRSFLDGYGRGETPNPCLACNREIRWGFLLDHALAVGAEFMATGHYARRRTDAAGRHELLRAVDTHKDQSYVLHVLDQAQLGRALFPLGELTKEQVRQRALDLGLPTATRKDSQDLCFLAGDDYRNFLRRHASEVLRPGEMVTREGAVLGQHAGLASYTIGQRKGLGSVSSIPMYVLAKDVAANRLVVGSSEQLGLRDLTTRRAHWIGGVAPAAALQADVKTRYTARQAAAMLTSLDDGSVRVRFDAPQRDLTAGQAAVFYRDEVVLGGGLIA